MSYTTSQTDKLMVELNTNLSELSKAIKELVQTDEQLYEYIASLEEAIKELTEQAMMQNS